MPASAKDKHGAAEAAPESNLAVLGGIPTFSEPIHVGRPNIGNRERFLERIETMLDRRYLTNSGPFEREFEQRLAEVLGVRYCVAMCNATIALEIAIRALNLTGEVIVPSFTFVATAHALQWQQITPVFCDIDPLTHNIDPQKIEALITRGPPAFWPCICGDGPARSENCRPSRMPHGLALLFDAAHAFGCRSWLTQDRSASAGPKSLAFTPRNSLAQAKAEQSRPMMPRSAERMQLMKNFGFAGYDNVISIGTNGKMNELSAAMGLTHLESAEEFAHTNRTKLSRLTAINSVEFAGFRITAL